MHASSSLPVFDLAQVLPGGFRFPARMTVLPLAGDGLALLSPIPIDDALAARLSELGQVRYLIAPNLLHHLYLPAASARYPQATVLAPAALRRKRPELRIDRELEAGLPPELSEALDVVRVDGAPSVDEHVFFHRATRSLVVTDLVFNMRRPEGWLAHTMLFCVGCHGRLAQSRAWRLFIKDRRAASASVERILALPAETLIMAHGDVEPHDAQRALASALRWLCPRPLSAASSAA